MTKHTITAFFDSREHAAAAALGLSKTGVKPSDVTMSPDTVSSQEDGGLDRPSKGFWKSLEDLFAGTDQRDSYLEGVRRGGVMIVAHVDDVKVDDAIAVLEQHGSIDLSARETAWRREGWVSGVETGGTVASGANPASATERSVETLPIGTKPMSSPQAGTDDVLQVFEESFKVSKRTVNHGTVRVHSHIVETPFSETVSLRDETVSVHRRPVDRTMSMADLGADAFSDRSIDMDEIDEEAVVAKSVRLVEEIGLRKHVTNRTQTVSDTVRSTRVDVEDERIVADANVALVKDMEVVGSDGAHVGIIDHVDGETIKLKRMDPASGGAHHLIPVKWIETVGAKAMLKTAAADAKRRWIAA